MARTIGTLPAGSRITNFISLGVIAKFFPLEKVREALNQTNRACLWRIDMLTDATGYRTVQVRRVTQAESSWRQ